MKKTRKRKLKPSEYYVCVTPVDAQYADGSTFEPYPDSIVVPCQNCGTKSWLGPKTRQFMREHQPALPVWCSYCLVRAGVVIKGSKVVLLRDGRSEIL